MWLLKNYVVKNDTTYVNIVIYFVFVTLYNFVHENMQLSCSTLRSHQSTQMISCCILLLTPNHIHFTHSSEHLSGLGTTIAPSENNFFRV